LLGYWYTLTHTPLYVSDKAEEEGISGDNLSALSENQRILSQMDTALALHLTPKDIRKQVTPSLLLPPNPPPVVVEGLCCQFRYRG
jgi:hypothetical protein